MCISLNFYCVKCVSRYRKTRSIKNQYFSRTAMTCVVQLDKGKNISMDARIDSNSIESHTESKKNELRVNECDNESAISFIFSSFCVEYCTTQFTAPVNPIETVFFSCRGRTQKIVCTHTYRNTHTSKTILYQLK